MKQHHTKDKGDLAVLKVQADLSQKGFMVLHPLTEHAPFDIVSYKTRFKRVQVKYRDVVNGKLDVSFKSVWNDKHGTHRNPIDKDEVDIVAIYCPTTDKVYYVDPKQFNGSVTLRVGAAQNNQSAGVNYADDFLQVP